MNSSSSPSFPSKHATTEPVKTKSRRKSKSPKNASSDDDDRSVSTFKSVSAVTGEIACFL